MDHLNQQRRNDMDNADIKQGNLSRPSAFGKLNFSQAALKNKGFSDKKIEFYTQKKKLVGARFSASTRINDEGSIFNKTATSNMATTPGSFFHARGQRNNT